MTRNFREAATRTLVVRKPELSRLGTFGHEVPAAFARVVGNGIASGPRCVGVDDRVAVGPRIPQGTRALRPRGENSEADRRCCRLDVVDVDRKKVGFPSAERQGIASLQNMRLSGGGQRSSRDGACGSASRRQERSCRRQSACQDDAVPSAPWRRPEASQLCTAIHPPTVGRTCQMNRAGSYDTQVPTAF